MQTLKEHLILRVFRIVENDQTITSAKTSLSQVAAATKKLANSHFKSGDKIVDYGGGKYDKGIDHVKEASNADMHVYDPFNRSREHNDKVTKTMAGKADHVTMNNVGNVIKDDSHLHQAIQGAKNFMHPEHGQFHMSVYEGDGTGNGRMTQGGESYQRHQKLKEYLPHVKKVFPDSEYQHSVKNGIISVKRK